MEIITPSSNRNINLIGDRDPIELDHIVYCGDCLVKMKKVDENTYKCLRCGAFHKEN